MFRCSASISSLAQFCSGLVDLVVGVGRHSGGGHRFTLAGQGFVGLVAEDIAQVGDRGIELGIASAVRGLEHVTRDGGRRLVASSRSNRAATAANGFLRFVVSPASCVLRIARVR